MHSLACKGGADDLLVQPWGAFTLYGAVCVVTLRTASRRWGTSARRIGAKQCGTRGTYCSDAERRGE